MPSGGSFRPLLMVFVTIAVSLSTRAGTGVTLSLCVVLFLLGLMSDYLFGRHAATAPWAAAVYGIIPNWQHFWAADALNAGGTIPWAYVRQAAGYSAAYSIAVLCLGMLSFRHAEVS